MDWGKIDSIEKSPSPIKFLVLTTDDPASVIYIAATISCSGSFY